MSIKLSKAEQIQFIRDHPNKELEWYLRKLNCSEATFYRRKRSIRNDSIAVNSNSASTQTTQAPITLATIDPDTHITSELVETWILTSDKRADLGMKFMQFRDKFSTAKIEVEEDYSDEFELLLTKVERSHVDNNSPAITE